ncbi:kinase-like domain-containing protein [Chytriomyces sp. MP71]|nr:kinase-like domain-containing protein [Chytriomyces sp. MP71]
MTVPVCSSPAFTPIAALVNKPAVTQKSAQLVVPPALAALATSSRNQSQLYDGLSSEQKARVAIVKAVSSNPELFLNTFSIRKVVGFGSNGVCVAGYDNRTNSPVCVKIIYKSREGPVNDALPSEVETLKHLSKVSTSRHLLKYIADFQDASHFILVTELFGSDWLATPAVAESGTIEGHLEPLVFQSTYNTNTTVHQLEFSAGSSDLWAWAYACRAHLFKTEGHSFLHFNPVKSIFKQIAVALFDLHNAGFYHGDVKIENILVQSGSETSDRPHIRLADFGHAKHASMGISSYGTQDVSPPEFLRDSPFAFGELDGRAADVFALGILLYVLVSENGERPGAVQAMQSGKIGYQYLASHNRGVFPLDGITDLDAEAWDLFAGMCAVDPEERISIEEVLAHSWLMEE